LPGLDKYGILKLLREVWGNNTLGGYKMNKTVESKTQELFWQIFENTGSLVAYILYSKLK